MKQMDDDHELVERSRSGDREAFGELVVKHQKSIYAFVFRLTGDMEEAKDLTQKTFVQAFQSLQGFAGRSRFRTWLYQIALNASRNHLTRERRPEVEADESLVSGESGVLAVMIDRQRRNRVKDALSSLPVRQRSAVLLRVYQGLSVAETAEVMGCTEGAVKAHYHHAVGRLRELVRED